MFAWLALLIQIISGITLSESEKITSGAIIGAL